MEKSPDAFRTISEVAEWLDIPTHVLRFWESRFSQIKPVKRAGGRRYYRPSDMRLIGGVKVLLHDRGMTIRAVQKALREEGIKHVSAFAPPLDSEAETEDGEVIEATAVEAEAPAPEAAPAPEPEVTAPAAAARGTHTAVPDPVETDLFEGLDDMDASEEASPPAPPVEVPPEVHEAPAAEEDAPVMFRRASRPAPFDEEAPEAAEEAPVVASAIPDTPGIPATDPSDEDPAFATDAGVAARITAMSRRRLAARPEALAEARERLVQLRDRLG